VIKTSKQESKKQENEIKPPTAIQLESLKDLIKLVISSTGPERVAGYIGHIKEGERSIYFIFNTSLGYYDLNALPIVIWVENQTETEHSFIRYKTSPAEIIEFTDDATDAKYVNIPIVRFKKLPDFLKVW